VIRRGVLAADFVAHLACPVSKQRLIYFPEDACFVSVAARLRYRIEEGVPLLLEEEAERLSEAEVNQLIDRARQLGLAVPA